MEGGSRQQRVSIDKEDIKPEPLFLSFQEEITKTSRITTSEQISELRLLMRDRQLLSYGPSLVESTRRMAYLVDAGS